MKVLITGISGFVGTNLSAYLINKQIIVDGCSQATTPKQDIRINKYFTYNELFLTDPADYDAIIHLAGKAHDLKKTSSADEYFKVNTELTKQVYNWYSKAPKGKFFYLSSVKAVADQSVIQLTENAVPNPYTAYGKSKLEAEKYILKTQAGTSYILRPCMIHGPGNKGNLNLLFKIVKMGLPWPLASFENKRSFLSIENLSFIIYKMILKHVPSGVYHVADTEPISTNLLIKYISESVGKKTRLMYVPEKVIRFAATIGDLLSLPLNNERLSKLTETYTVSNEKVIKALGENLPVSSKEGLTITLQSFENEHKY